MPGVYAIFIFVEELSFIPFEIMTYFHMHILYLIIQQLSLGFPRVYIL